MFSVSALGQQWWTNAKNFGGNVSLTPAQESAGLQFWTQQATALYTQLQAAVVAPGSFVAPSGGGNVSGIGGPIT
jgi:hypothetical protein